jgi:hypothetical protein
MNVSQFPSGAHSVTLLSLLLLFYYPYKKDEGDDDPSRVTLRKGFFCVSCVCALEVPSSTVLVLVLYWYRYW